MSVKPGPSTIMRARESCSSAGRTSPCSSCRAQASPDERAQLELERAGDGRRGATVSYSRAPRRRGGRASRAPRRGRAPPRRAPARRSTRRCPGSPDRRPAARPASRWSPGSGASSPARSGSGTPSRSAPAASSLCVRPAATRSWRRRSPIRFPALGPSPVRTRVVVSGEVMKGVGTECAPHFTRTQDVPGGHPLKGACPEEKRSEAASAEIT